jgi:hypothetical protein
MKVNMTSGIISNAPGNYYIPWRTGARLEHTQSGGDYYFTGRWNPQPDTSIAFDLSGGNYLHTGSHSGIFQNQGTFNISGGYLLLANDYTIPLGDADGPVSVTQSGGIVQIGNASHNRDLQVSDAAGRTASYVLSGGSLQVRNRIFTSSTADKTFTFTGGSLTMLEWDTSMGALTNAGGALSPGYTNVGKTTVEQPYEMTSSSASVAIDLGGTTPATVYTNGPGYHDYVVLSQGGTLQGSLDVLVTDAFAASIQRGDSFTIMHANSGTISGTFDNVVDGRVIAADGKWWFAYSNDGTDVVLSDARSYPPPGVIIRYF